MRLTLATLAAAALALLPSSTALPLSPRQLTPPTAPLAVELSGPYGFYISTERYACPLTMLGISGASSSSPVDVDLVSIEGPELRRPGTPNDTVVANVAVAWTENVLLWDIAKVALVDGVRTLNGTRVAVKVTSRDGQQAFTNAREVGYGSTYPWVCSDTQYAAHQKSYEEPQESVFEQIFNWALGILCVLLFAAFILLTIGLLVHAWDCLVALWRARKAALAAEEAGPAVEMEERA
ncbi:hypothetical protein JCM10213_007604 [Rhodosporidiobolus nylandii]